MNSKRQIVRGGVLVALAVLIGGIFAPITASAADANPEGAFNFAVSPPSVGIVAKPGVPTSFDIRVQNQGIATEKVKVTLMKFTAQGETGLPNLRDFEKTDDFSKWAQLSPTSFTADPNEWKTVKFNLTPAKDAAFGYYYAVVFSREGAAAKPAEKNKSSLLASVASLVLIDVQAPGAQRIVNIAEFSTVARGGEFLPVEFNVRLRNNGNTHVGVRGTINISQRGKSVADIDVNSKKGYLLPGSFRNFSTQWKDGSPVYKDIKNAQGVVQFDADGKAKQKLVWDDFKPSKLRMGKYDARLIIVYDDGNGDVSTTAKLSFWVIPWRIIIVIGLILLLAAGGIWFVVIRPLIRGARKSRGYAVRR